MKIETLRQPPFETTLMGVVKAVSEHYGLSHSDPTIYGGSGHAFLVNVHGALCPSSPYCWKYDGMLPLLQNLGLTMTDLGFHHPGTPREERAAVEEKLREHLDQGHPCSLCNMDNQVIHGYDDEGFDTARPWPKNPDYPPGRLTFGEWTELGAEIHVNFFAFERVEPADSATIRRESLRYAVDLYRHPERYEFDGYGIGPRAYEHWAAAAEEHGASHGNWWNGTVWSECRARASEYMEEIAADLTGDAEALARDLSVEYRRVSEGLAGLADKELAPDRKAELARDLGRREALAVRRVESLLGRLA